MVKRKKTKLLLNLLTISFKYIIIVFAFLNCTNTSKNSNNIKRIEQNRSVEKVKSSNNNLISIGFFDYDTLKDTIVCKKNNENGEPVYNCTIFFGNKKNKNILIPTVNGDIQLTNCEKGCIETYEWITGSDGFEERNKYKYDNELNNWFLIESVYTDSEDNDKIEKPNKQWSIDVEILKIKGKTTILSLYDDIYFNFKENSFEENQALMSGINLKADRILIDKNSLAKYNNIAYYLEQSKLYKEAIFLLEKIIKKFPNRTVAYINLGDAYWGLDKKNKAKEAYKIYVKQMKSLKRKNRIPKKVIDRLN